MLCSGWSCGTWTPPERQVDVPRVQNNLQCSGLVSPELQSMSRDMFLKEQDLFRNRPESDVLGNGRERHVP